MRKPDLKRRSTTCFVTKADVVALAQDLIRCPSVTPEEGGALDLCEGFLEARGFQTWRLSFEEVDNLFARFGAASPHLCFAGHTDVVPVGDEADWTQPPFAANIEGDTLYGRGAEDMKGNVAAAMVAASDFLEANPDFGGSISFLLTGDEEGPAINGTKRVLEWMAANDQVPDQCLIIEPTATTAPGDTLKVGRRGSMNGYLTVTGTQGHAAYPQKADNPLPRLVQMLGALTSTPLDAGTEHFEATSLQLTTIDVGNPATNVIPAQGTATFNVRFNDTWTPETLLAEIKVRLDSVGATYDLRTTCNAVSFMTPLDRLATPLANALEAATGTRPALTTTGGTSDARFVQAYCPVVEMGLPGRTMHQVDENISIDQLNKLTDLYGVAIRALTL